jgi:hypothetical protein
MTLSNRIFWEQLFWGLQERFLSAFSSHISGDDAENIQGTDGKGLDTRRTT